MPATNDNHQDVHGEANKGPPYVATPCTKWANGARRGQPAPNDHQIHCGATPTLIRYKGKFEFHQKLRRSGSATNFWISNADYTTSLDLPLIFVFAATFQWKGFDVRGCVVIFKKEQTKMTISSE